MLDWVIRIFFFLIFVGSGIYHLVNPDFFMPLMPSFLPQHRRLIIWSGWAEIVVGIALFVPPVRQLAGWGVIGLLVIFLPIHLLEKKKKKPAVGSKGIAVGRLLMQFVLIYGATLLL